MNAIKPKTCKHCGTTFHPARMMQRVCSAVCAGRLVKAAKKEQREQIKSRKEKIKTIPELKREAQTAFNAFIRARDTDKPCISCGRPLKLGGVGGGFDAGHYRSVGAAGHLRFNEDNCHGQCKQCNSWKAGNAVDYRAGLINRIGLERLEVLEAANFEYSFKAEELRFLKREYVSKRKLLEQT